MDEVISDKKSKPNVVCCMSETSSWNANLSPLQYVNDPGPSLQVEELTKGNTSKPIVVYCRSGTRSQYAKEFLISKGYSYVSNLGGAAQAQVLTDLMLDESSK